MSMKHLNFSVFFLSLILLSTNTLASLSAITANTIVGIAPIIPAETIEKIKSGIYFSITDPLDYSYDYSPGSLTTIYLPLGSKFSEITPKAAPNLIPTDIIDSDGDILSSTLPYSITNFNYTWQYSNGTEISSSSTDNLGANICFDRSTYKGPYTLNISFDITVNTEYGDPNSTTQTIEKIFIVNANDGICVLRPGNLVNETKNGWPDGDGNNTVSAGRD